MLDSHTTTASPFPSRPTWPRLAFIPVSLLLVLLVVAGCGGSDDTTATAAVTTTITSTILTTTTTTVPTTTVPTTTSTNVTTTTGPGADDGYVVGSEPGVYPGPHNATGPLSGSGGAGGSGCDPGTTSLPDGIWFGLVTAKTDASITFDLACFFFGPIAVEEGAHDGVFIDPIGEVYIRNANPTLRTITVDPSVSVFEYFEDLTDTIEVPFKPVPFIDWPEDPSFPNPCPGKTCGVWLFVNSGAVTEMMEQFFAPCAGNSTSNCVPIGW